MNYSITTWDKCPMEFELKNRHKGIGVPIMHPINNKEGYYWIKEVIDDDWFVAHYTPENEGEWSYPGLDDPVKVKEGRTIIIGLRLNPPKNYEGLLVRPDLHKELRKEYAPKINKKMKETEKLLTDLEKLLNL